MHDIMPAERVYLVLTPTIRPIPQQSMGRYRIDNSAVFNTLVVLCLRRLPEALDHLMQMKSPQPGKRCVLERGGKRF